MKILHNYERGAILKDQRGVALILELILVAAVLALVGLAVYSSSHAKKAQSPVAKVSMTPTPSPTPTPTPTPSPTKPANEFDVPELGFKMTLPEGLTGLMYAINPNHTGTANGTYTFSSASFTTQYLDQNGCYSGDQNDTKNTNTWSRQIGIGNISRYSVDPKTVIITGSAPTKQVGSFWLAYGHPQATCGGNATVNANQGQMIQLLMQAFNTASPL